MYCGVLSSQLSSPSQEVPDFHEMALPDNVDYFQFSSLPVTWAHPNKALSITWTSIMHVVNQQAKDFGLVTSQ